MVGRSGGNLQWTIDALWRQAFQNGLRGDQQSLTIAFKCLYAGLALVLPAAAEIRFRLLLAQLLQRHTANGTEAVEHIRKALQLVAAREECPWLLHFLTVSMWAQTAQATSDCTLRQLLLEARELASKSGQLDWWLHFDYLAACHRLLDIPRSSIAQLSDNAVLPFRIFAKLLCQTCSYGQQHLKELEKELIQLDGASSLTLKTVGLLACLKERIEAGEDKEASMIIQMIGDTIEACDGLLPGYLLVGTDEIKAWHHDLHGLYLLRCGEPINLTQYPSISLTSTFSSWLKFDFSSISKTFNMDDFVQLCGKGAVQSYGRSLLALQTLVQRLPLDPETVLTSLPALEATLHPPQLQCYRLIIEAIAQRQAGHPIHHVKTCLLSALKLLNSRTQNAQLKCLALLLLGQLYLDTDFEMALKMFTAARSFAKAPQWTLFLYHSNLGLYEAHLRLGNNLEADKYFRMAAELQTGQLGTFHV